MTKVMIEQKLAGIIETLDSIIDSGSEEANGSPELRECRENLSILLSDFVSNKKLESEKVLVAIYKAAELLYSWTKTEN